MTWRLGCLIPKQMVDEIFDAPPTYDEAIYYTVSVMVVDIQDSIVFDARSAATA
ncbi:hypothetical protein SNOG_00907 [Parastagonospora nodorum SN15]|uniref:Uncharacterized protein n=1 Tax=Phaeosphaeria nodorum (strain SN15 / ATCC MYA-4574 / FGSC 10173) TaxID=321614 RepID=Q0V507_PHANO|nr:hypothetical protein SNOG_00907 [Parastagonospora nodorum SN15]EAT92402.1 hypothetical protein SNOG_00907 [Parastagonospora nodorum SN15]